MTNNEKIGDVEFKILNLSEETEIYSESVNSGGWIDYGKDNNYPGYLLDLLNKSPKHNAIVKSKVAMIGGNGFNLKNAQPATINFIANVYGEYTLKEILARVVYDYELYGGFYLSITWSKDRTKISRIEHIPYSKVRIAAPSPKDKNISYYLVSDNWNAYNNEFVKYQEFSTTKKQKATQILYVKDHRPDNEYYTVPEYLAAFNWISLEAKLSEFYLSNVNDGFTPQLMINFPSGIPTDEQMRRMDKKLTAEYAGAKGKKVIFTYSSDSNSAPKITTIQSSSNDTTYSELLNYVTEGIIVSHRITNAALLGIKTPGELGATNELLDSLNLFQAMYVTPKQNYLEDIFNRLARINNVPDKLTIEKYRIDVKVKLSVADILNILQSPIPGPNKISVLEFIGATSEDAQKMVDGIPDVLTAPLPTPKSEPASPKDINTNG